MKCLDSDFLIDILAGKKEAEHKMLEIENERLATMLSIFLRSYLVQSIHRTKRILKRQKEY